jgi:NDP-sugar pyrophosphorylase family protein
MKAVLLGAGLGTRLGPLAGDAPKILAPLAGEPLLAHQLRYLAREGCDEVLLNVHHRADQVIAFLDEFDSPVRTIPFHEDELLGTAGALLPMRDLLDEPFVLQYGDVLTDARLRALLDDHSRLGGVATLTYYESTDTREKGLLELAPDSRITGFAEKPEGEIAVGNVNAGIYALDPAILEFIPPRGDFGFDVWPAVTAAGRPIYGHRVDAYVRDVGSVETLRRAEADLEQGALAW